MKKYTLLMLAGLALSACTDKDGDTGDTSNPGDGGAADGGADGGGDDALYVDCSWGSGSVTVSITNGDAAGYDFGMAETDSASPDPWTGEDCGYVGYTTGDGTYYDICHGLSATGGTLTSVDAVGDIVAGSTTVFDGTQLTSYYLYEVASGTCWTWGHDATYFFDCLDASGAVGGTCG